jgi:hypothetical protein
LPATNKVFLAIGETIGGMHNKGGFFAGIMLLRSDQNVLKAGEFGQLRRQRQVCATHFCEP